MISSNDGVKSGTSVIFMTGVSGSGKSTVGGQLAESLGWHFLDADDFHPAENVAKMAAGIALTDDDRWPWLRLVGQNAASTAGAGVVVACSALRRAYRDVLREECPNAVFVQLIGGRDLIAARMESRDHAYMPPTLLGSQLAVFEPLDSDEPGFQVDVTRGVEAILESISVALRDRAFGG